MSYSTKQRALILNLLKKKSDKHLTADDISSELKQNGEAVGKATIYRELNRLHEAGIIRKYSGESGEGACYQYISNEKCREHFHLKCGGCGELFHIQCKLLSSLENHVKNDHDFHIDSSKTVFYGECKECGEYRENS